MVPLYRFFGANKFDSEWQTFQEYTRTDYRHAAKVSPSLNLHHLYDG